MNLINYLTSKIKNTPSKDEFIKINKFYVYKDLISFKQLQQVLKKHNDMQLLRMTDLEVINKYGSKIINEVIEKLNLDHNQKTYFYLSNYEGNINKSKIFYYQNNVVKIEKIEDHKKLIGVGFFRKILTKKEIIKNKKYNSLDDLIKDPNIAIYHKKTNISDEIIGYDMSQLNSFTNFTDNFKLPILFAGIIIHNDRLIDKISQDGSIIDGTASRGDVFGRMTLYPLLGYLSRNHIIMPDRDSISDAAKSVWSNFFKNNLNIVKEAPIDDFEKPITINDLTDDGRTYIKDKLNPLVDSYDLEKIKNMNLEDQKKYLINLRKNDPFNWTYKLKDPSEPRKVLKELKERHLKFLNSQGNIIINKLENLANDFYVKNIA